jgi:hypothetical protein
MTNVENTTGLSRSYFYRRLADAMREVVDRDYTVYEEQEYDVATDRRLRVNIQDSLNRLKFCPACGQQLETYEDCPQNRNCEHGEFSVTDIWDDGELAFQFILFPVDSE